MWHRIGHEKCEVNLFDLRPLRPFVNTGLRFVLLILAPVAAVWSGVVAFGGEFQTTPLNWLVSYLLLAGIALTVLVVPIWGVHRRIREQKHQELDRISSALRGAPEALQHSPLAAQVDSLRGVELLEYKRHVESVSEWPFDGSAFARLTLYLMIPALGWVGGALVERLVERVLD
jgi:hypothetical protein